MITPVFNLAKIALVARFGYRYDEHYLKQNSL